MKIVVTHDSPDLDAITSVWIIKKFLPGWDNASVQFVPAGERINKNSPLLETIETIGQDKVIHVDTGMGPLDHHQTDDQNVCAASRTWGFVRANNPEFLVNRTEKAKDKTEAVGRMVKVVVDIDHFKEVFWKDATADYHEFSFVNALDGFRLMRPNENQYYVVLGMEYLDAVLHEFENRIWAEKEIVENGRKFKTRFGEGIGFETINDSVIKLAQKMGYAVVARKDPRKGYVRIKAMPSFGKTNIDLTLAYEKLRKMDPAATWYLHVSKKMLLNGSVKNPKMRPTRLGLGDIIRVLERM